MNFWHSSTLSLLISCADIVDDKDLDLQPPDYPSSKGTHIDYSHRLIGENPLDWSGTAIAANGDFDGDGRNDILVGAMMNDDSQPGGGKVYLVPGADLTDIDYDLSTAISFVPDLPGGCAGASVTFIKDQDNDGRDEVLIGSPCINKSHLFMASSIHSSNSLNDADRIYRGQEAGDYLGWSSAYVGDVNGDGKGDFLLGADGADNLGTSSGKAMLVTQLGWNSDQPINIGDISTELWGARDFEMAGNAVAGNGDIDGDGLMDILVGAKGSQEGGANSGKVYLAQGRDIWSFGIQELNVFARRFIGSEHDQAGASVAFANDINGDGLDDVLIGAPSTSLDEDRNGKVYVLFADSLNFNSLQNASAQVQGLFAGDHSGFSVSKSSDFDADGQADIVIGSPSLFDNFHTGEAYLYSGNTIAAGGYFSIEDATHVFKGNQSGSKMGYSIAVGDVSGNGEKDILIGAPGSGSSEQGAIFLFSNTVED